MIAIKTKQTAICIRTPYPREWLPIAIIPTITTIQQRRTAGHNPIENIGCVEEHWKNEIKLVVRTYSLYGSSQNK
jgi:hypothetical protein